MEDRNRWEQLVARGSLPSVVDLNSVGGYVEASLSENTRRAYRAALADFEAWSAAHGLQSLPAAPEVVAGYAAALADDGRSVSTVTQRLAAIRWAHEARGFETPTSSIAGLGLSESFSSPHTAGPSLRSTRGCCPQ